MEMQIKVATPAAQSWLKSSRNGGVLHVFPAACNFVDSGGTVLSLVKREEAINPFSMLVSNADGIYRNEFLFDMWLDIDSTVDISSTEFSVGEIKFTCQRARIWNPVVVWDDIHPERVMSSLPLIEDSLRSVAPRGSLFEMLDGGYVSEMHSGVKSAWHDLKSGLIGNDMSVVVSSVHSLAGLGEGLTPAGDDFLLGVIYSMWIMGEARDLSTISLIVSEAKPLTTKLSAAWLSAAGSGEAGIMWHWLMKAIQTGNEKEVTSIASRIGRVGHTSGADALSGFIASAKLLSDRRRLS